MGQTQDMTNTKVMDSFRIDTICEHCGDQFTTPRSNVRRGWGRFCSRQCSSEWRRQIPMLNRFTGKTMPVTESGCHLWIGATDKDGYGKFCVNGNNALRAHRVSYELFKGPIPNGTEIDHLCRVHCCVNPNHLEAVPHRVNVLRGVGASARNINKTHCPHGHIYDAANTHIDKEQSRHCRACDKRRAMVRRNSASRNA